MSPQLAICPHRVLECLVRGGPLPGRKVPRLQRNLDPDLLWTARIVEGEAQAPQPAAPAQPSGGIQAGTGRTDLVERAGLDPAPSHVNLRLFSIAFLETG